MPIACGLLAVTGNSLIDQTTLTAIENAGQDVSASVSSVITTVLPVALGIMGLVMAITIGVALFKKLTKSGARG